MSYSTDVARLLADQLSRFVTLNSYQLAGQVANLDFWMAEVRHALAVIDGYGVRFVRLEGAQNQFVETHGVEKVTRIDGIAWRNVNPVRRVPDRELQKARQTLADAALRFLWRCRDEGLIGTSLVAAWVRDAGIEDDPTA